MTFDKGIVAGLIIREGFVVKVHFLFLHLSCKSVDGRHVVLDTSVILSQFLSLVYCLERKKTLTLPYVFVIWK